MEQVHDQVRRGPQLEILPVGENPLLSRAEKQNEKRISKSTFWRMLGPNLQKIMTSKWLRPTIILYNLYYII